MIIVIIKVIVYSHSNSSSNSSSNSKSNSNSNSNSNNTLPPRRRVVSSSNRLSPLPPASELPPNICVYIYIYTSILHMIII